MKGNNTMREIKGTNNTALCYASTMDDGALEQITTICNMQEFAHSKIRIMPDAHAGKGCTIGTTMTIIDKVVPSMVGVDIGCGMYTVSLGKVEIDLDAFDKAAYSIPSGRDVWDGRKERFDLEELCIYRSLKDTKRLERSIGTLGGGNHFIEIDTDDEGCKYLVIHSGSRNLGTQTANIYQQLAVDLNTGKDKLFDMREEIIRTYKEQGRRAEIQDTLKKLTADFKGKQPTLPADLCYLYGKYMQDYLHDADICRSFAKRNREKIAELLLEMTGHKAQDSFHTVHNYIDTDSMILRKGAVSAKENEMILVPINMRDGSFICKGLGNPEWNFSAPHGAGRLMSRADAFERLTMEEYRESMQGIYTTCINSDTLDESPMAYKSMAEIEGNIAPTAQIIKRIRPIYNFKAAQ